MVQWLQNGPTDLLGISSQDNSYIIYDKGDIAMIRTVARFPDAKKWNMERLAAVHVTPCDLHLSKKATVHFKEKVEGEQVMWERRKQATRQIYLKRSDFDLYGQTDGCQRCDFDTRFGYGRSTSRTAQHPERESSLN